MTYDVYAKISKKLYAGNPVGVSAQSNPRSHGFARARRAAALVLLGGCLFSSNLARADEVAPTMDLSQSPLLTLYQNDLSAYNERCDISSQAADGTFSCTTDSGKPLTGKIVGVTNTLGQVVTHKISLTLRVSSTVSESFTGAAKAVGEGSANVFIAGTYARKMTKYYRLSNGSTMPVTSVTNPLPFAGMTFSISG